METDRQLPVKRNYLMIGDDVPTYSELVTRRRLGQTQLTSKMVGHANVDERSLGVFDYAHLRAPLPKGIVSGVFKSSPASYFLMRRSSDGYVSATGMFKATFPWAEAAEEEAERTYIKSLSSTSHEETAGNIWVPPEDAINLAKEYGIDHCIFALLDPTDIAPAASKDARDSQLKQIKAPPKFDRLKKPNHAPVAQPEEAPAAPSIMASAPSLAPPTPSQRSTRSRRSASPTKPTRRTVASPRKRSTRAASAQASEAPEPMPMETYVEVKTRKAKTKAAKEEVEAPKEETITESTNAVPVADEFTFTAAAQEAVVSLADEEPKANASVEQDTEINGDAKTQHTAIVAEMPILSGPPTAEETAAMLAKAKEMVEAAAAEETEMSEVESKTKRKAEEVEADEQEKKAEEGTDEPQIKRAKTDVEQRKEQVKRRALFGIGATLAVGAILPYVMGAL